MIKGILVYRKKVYLNVILKFPCCHVYYMINYIPTHYLVKPQKLQPDWSE